MTVYATCGHDITNGEYVQLAIMDYSRMGNPAVSHGTYCKACAAVYEGWGIVLHGEAEQKAWLYGELNYPEMSK